MKWGKTGTLPLLLRPNTPIVGNMMDDFEISDDLYDLAAPAAMPYQAPAWLETLNPEQRAAVETTDGPVLVLSGAGTGKTRVLTTRLAYLLEMGLAKPWHILAVTFTNKAAREMRSRTADMVGPVGEQAWLGTFHALAMRILKRHPEKVGLKSGFIVLDTDDQLRLIKQLAEAAGLDSKRWPPQGISSRIQRWKDKGYTPDNVPPHDLDKFADGRLLALYKAYQGRLQELNACDFGDLLLHNLTLFQQYPDILAEYQQQFHYIMVDEYQDTNVAQYLWLRYLARQHNNLCCVGDDDQSIYSWRGAEVGNILKFEQDFPNATVIRLERNYRSTGHILGAASGLIAHNSERLGKELIAANDIADAAYVHVKGTMDGRDEAEYVADLMARLHRAGKPYKHMAILVRAAFQTRPFEERLTTVGIPHMIIGGLRFYEREEVRDAMAYLRALLVPSDDLAFERIINKPTRGVGAGSLGKVRAFSAAHRIPMQAAIRQMLDNNLLTGKAKTGLTTLIHHMDTWAKARAGLPPAEMMDMIIKDSGLKDMWIQQKAKDPKAEGRVENLNELVTSLGAYESLEAFLEHVSLVMDMEQAQGTDAITIMTLHGAKGLEFDTVFLPGWEEDIFPHRRALEDNGSAALEEERRLAYVGITRAKREAYISYAGYRTIYGQSQSTIPSRFLEELPEKHIKWVRESLSFGGGSGYGAASGFGHGRGQSAWPGRPIHTNTTGHASTTGQRPRKKAPFDLGQDVMHPKFGAGVVINCDGEHVEVCFESGSTKKLIASFLKPAS
jgi:DNA helicase-2/ATP-dependent DNA helicase PcrA